MVAQGGQRQAFRRGAVHERDRSKRRLADGAGGNRQAGCVGDGEAPCRRELHEEVVRMLAINERPSVESLAHLKDLAVSCFSGRRRIQAEHPGQGEPAPADPSRCHLHPPVRCLELVAASRTSLMIEQANDHAVVHEHPRRLLILIRGVLVLVFLGRNDHARREHARGGRRDKSTIHGSLLGSDARAFRTSRLRFASARHAVARSAEAAGLRYGDFFNGL